MRQEGIGASHSRFSPAGGTPLPVIDAHRFSPTALASLAEDDEHLTAAIDVIAAQARDLLGRRTELRLLQVSAPISRSSK